MILSNYAIRNRTTVFVLMLIIAVVGGYSYISLPRESAPDIQIPYIVVTTTYKGVAPSDVENLITKEIETKIRSISDVDEITSTSDEGLSSITVKFLPSTDLDTALQKVRDKVDAAKSEMPSDIDEPEVSEINISEFPIMLLNIHGPCGLRQLKDIAEDLQDDLEKIDGVLEARISGGLTRQIRIEVDPYRLAAYHLPVPALFNVIAAENQNVSGGAIDISEAKYSVRVEGEFTQPTDIFTLVVHEVDGKPVYLADVAAVRDTFEDRLSISRFNGEECVTVAVVKRAGKSIVGIAEQVKTIVADYQATRLPTGTRIDVTSDQSKAIGMMVKDLENNMICGLILVVAVLMVSMGLRSSLMVAVAIPFSMFMTFVVLMAMGITLNMIVLFTLILVSGMLVDNAIVIVENIYRHMQEGEPRIQAAMTATGELAWPMIGSTATTLAAFVPLLWWTGIMGEFMWFLPTTMIIAQITSLFVALVMNATLCAVFIRVKGAAAAPAAGQARADADGDYLKGRSRAGTAIIRGYQAILTTALRPWARPVIIVGGLVLLVGSYAAFAAFNNKVEFFPQGDPNTAQVNITLPVGTRIEETDRIAGIVEDIVRKYQVTDGADPRRNIKFVTTTVGGGGSSIGTFLGGGSSGSNRAQISIEFFDFDERDVPSNTTVQALREQLTGFPGVDVTVEVEKDGPPAGRPVEIRVSGEDYSQLIGLSDQVKDILATIPGVTDLDDDYDSGKPELRVSVNRQRAGQLGLTTGAVAQVLKAAFNGIEVGKYREGNDDYDIVVRLPERFRREIADLKALTVASSDGKQVPLSAVADVGYTSGVASIQRTDEKRTITVFSDVVKGHENNSNDIIRIAREKLAALPRPSGYSIAFVGEQEEQNKASDFLGKAAIVAILGIALILVAQFNSVTLPAIVVFSVFLSFIGVFLGLTVFHMPYGVIMTTLGVISLAGVVVNNAIVLLDYIEVLRHRGLPLVEAVIRAGTIRMRPVLLTAVTSIIGLIPMVLGWNLDFRDLAFNFRSESSIWWGPMAKAIVFGLTVATVLTLVVVPALYVMLDPLRARWDRKHHDSARGVTP
jgi:multidrug efflux pump subunit AcrB